MNAKMVGGGGCKCDPNALNDDFKRIEEKHENLNVTEILKTFWPLFANCF